jgi:serine/threonine protein kinase
MSGSNRILLGAFIVINPDPPSKYHPTISPKLDRCIMKMIDLKPENRFQAVWDVISEIETLPDNY